MGAQVIFQLKIKQKVPSRDKAIRGTCKKNHFPATGVHLGWPRNECGASLLQQLRDLGPSSIPRPEAANAPLAPASCKVWGRARQDKSGMGRGGRGCLHCPGIILNRERVNILLTGKTPSEQAWISLGSEISAGKKKAETEGNNPGQQGQTDCGARFQTLFACFFFFGHSAALTDIQGLIPS